MKINKISDHDVNVCYCFVVCRCPCRIHANAIKYKNHFAARFDCRNHQNRNCFTIMEFHRIRKQTNKKWLFLYCYYLNWWLFLCDAAANHCRSWMCVCIPFGLLSQFACGVQCAHSLNLIEIAS